MKKRIFAGILSVVLVGIMLVGCGASNGGASGQTAQKPTITVGSKDFTENRILGNMIALLLEKSGFPVKKKFGLSTVIAAKALQNGDIDVYPEYTGTGLVTILKEKVLTDPDATYNAVQKGYESKFKEQWLGRFGLNDTYTLVMEPDKAKALGITSISDLAKHAADLKFGSDQEFLARPDGYPGLMKAYGLKFKKKNIKSMDAGLVYNALASGQVDVIMGFSTDGAIAKLHLVTLKDDKHFFPVYDAAPVIRQDVLKRNPEIATILNKLQGKISNQTMQELNYQVDVKGKDPAQVAKDFLSSQGLI
ncbi:carnitine transport binding protein OpuCC precursor [Peptococcaceae bacterium CEB3]|nr:carnitine transport binding protein OpuCC precursor [Peptococcaceae bacterium CEB3]